MMHIEPNITAYFKGFDQIMRLRGEVYRHHKNRLTQKIRLQKHFYFLKQHHGTGWGEIFRNLLSGRLPIVSAEREWRAIQRLQTLGIPTPAVCAVGRQGWNPATCRSFLLTRELPPTVTLETLAQMQNMTLRFKWRLLESVGTIAGTLHRHGINHRDFYLCHLLLDRRSLDDVKNEKNCPDPLIYVIDLHRAGMRRRTPLRWILKDLAGLDFSSRPAGLTSRDRLRFIRAYEAAAGRIRHSSFWHKVRQRGDRLTQRHGQ